MALEPTVSVSAQRLSDQVRAIHRCKLLDDSTLDRLRSEALSIRSTSDSRRDPPAPPPPQAPTPVLSAVTPREGLVAEEDDFANNSSTQAEKPAVCSSCKKVIQGRVVTALNEKWHPEHFTCNTCRKPIDGAKFHQHDGRVHCVPCFTQHHSPRCHGCGEPITDRVIQALGVSWHAHHFICGVCRKELGGGGFMEQAGRPYCSSCYADKYAARCKGCGKPIVDKAIIALDAKWHRDCFTCTKCRNPVTDATFSVYENKPLCGKCCG